MPTLRHNPDAKPWLLSVSLNGLTYDLYLVNGNMIGRIVRRDDPDGWSGWLDAEKLYREGVIGRVWGGPATFADFAYYIIPEGYAAHMAA